MGTLRNQMTDAMKLRRFSPRTQQSYLAAVTALANYYHTAPDQLDFEKIKAYLLHLTVERTLSWSTCNVAVSALRFFYTEVLGWEKVSLPIPPRQKPKTLPVILSRPELERLFACAGAPKYRVLLMTTYAAGLRVSEVVNLKPADIDSNRQMIRVEQAKGRQGSLHPAFSPATRRTPALLETLPAHHLAVSQQQRSAAQAGYRPGAEDLLRGQTQGWDHPWSRHPHTTSLLCHAFARSRS
jgi:site-specific recombinase XerD